ncbi:hypothetical protein IWW36_001194 [Coemansia brasiliensis]|uniref:RRM domain-containing protein n=1 Tax=Coemansia brasiliensis TaxID=2650707 RepID=A0A9W8I9Z3_9FUNG|nr:hypothetical protein IWW36_001194 [Coemansia brasiliensis]
MATHLDQSLDDIIKNTPRNRGGRRSGGRNQNRNSPYSRRDGGVQKRDGGKKQQQSSQMMMLNNPAYLAALQQQQQQQTRGPGKILISNLDYGVTEADLRALFQQIGPLSRVTLNYNRKGTSNGSGEVVFKNASHAQVAYDRYHDVELDHRKMRIEVVASSVAPAVVPMIIPQMMPQAFEQQQQQQSKGSSGRGKRGGNSQQNSNNAQGSNKSGGRGRRGGRAARENKPMPTAEELDAELDEYMKDVEPTA